VVQELLGDPVPLGGRRAGDVVHSFHLREVGFADRERAQHRAVQPEDPDLLLQRVRVRRGDVGEGGLPVQYPADRREAEPQFAQGADQRQPGRRRLVVPAVSGAGAPGDRQQAEVGVVPDGLTGSPVRRDNAPMDSAVPVPGWSCSLTSSTVPSPVGGDSSVIFVVGEFAWWGPGRSGRQCAGPVRVRFGPRREEVW
jgi:hypothetical protein